jgi:hypothetical protein
MTTTENQKTLQMRAANGGGSRAYVRGRCAEAILIHEATLKVCERALGPEHPDTLTSRSNLARAYRAVGRDADADASDKSRVFGLLKGN